MAVAPLLVSEILRSLLATRGQEAKKELRRDTSVSNQPPVPAPHHCNNTQITRVISFIMFY